MYLYPSLWGSSKAPHLPCIAFYKHDGSNLRFEWQPKKGWFKFGTRHCLFDKTESTFGKSIAIFLNKYGEAVEKVIQEDKQMRNAQSITAFAEFEGPLSFAGQHEPNDKHDLILFDIRIHKKGLMSPREFINKFGHLHIPRIVYEGTLNSSFIQGIRENKYNLNEGVVCKGGSGHDLWMCKIKTNDYIERLKNRFGSNWEKYAEE